MSMSWKWTAIAAIEVRSAIYSMFRFKHAPLTWHDIVDKGAEILARGPWERDICPVIKLSARNVGKQLSFLV